jgi:hypothetical protein
VVPEAGGFMKSDKIILHLQPEGSQPSPRVKLAAKTTIQGTPSSFLLFILSLRPLLRMRDILVGMDPDPAIFVIDLQDANRNNFFAQIFCLLLL